MSCSYTWPIHSVSSTNAGEVLRPGGQAIFQVYNRVSWLNALSKLMKVDLEHEDAPVLLKFSIAEVSPPLLAGFRDVTIVPERFPVKSRLHGGWKGAVYNGLLRRRLQRGASAVGNCAATAGTSWRFAASNRPLHQLTP